jgi:DNA-directed RNA polymerase alpha subunit
MTRNEMIYAERKNGATFKAIGKRYGITAERVRHICENMEDTNLPFYSDFKGYGNLGIRICHCLNRAGVETKEELIKMVESKEIMKVRNFGEACFDAVCKVYGIPKEVGR